MLIRNIKTEGRKYLWKILKLKWRLKTGIQAYVKSDNDWFVFNEIFTDQEYDEVFQLLPDTGIRDPLVLDLGANVGYFSVRMAHELLMRRMTDFTIYAIEASEENYTELLSRTNQPFLVNRCKPIHGLVGQKNGFSFLNTNTDHFGYHIEKNNTTGEKTSFIDIEKLLEKDDRRITLLKCDIEGSEEIFLNEYTHLLQKTDLSIFEFHADACNIPQCRKYLEESGLKYLKTVKTIHKYQTTVEIFKR